MTATRTETTERMTKLWWCLRTVSYERLKETWSSEEVSFCVFWSARQVNARPLSGVKDQETWDETNKCHR